MGAFVVYTFEAGNYILAAYLIYKWVLSGENQPSFNRAVLLLIYVLALTLPFVPQISFPITDAPIIAQQIEIGLPIIEVIESNALRWTTIVVYAYFAGMVLIASTTIISFIRIISIVHRGRRVAAGKYTIILLPSTNLAPFSWMRYIVMSESDYDEVGDMIVCHEKSHLHLLHWIDLLLAQIVVVLLWYNPASWLMRAELRCVHEYQADSTVLNSGTEARQYQLLLIKKAVGQRFPSLANSLNHSKLKKRITMMCNPVTGKGRRMRALAIVPAFAAALVLINIPSLASDLSKVAATTLPESVGKISEKTLALQDSVFSVAVLEIKPEFPGGEQNLYKYLADNINYPTDAAKKGETGRVVVQFIVEPDGAVTNCEVVRNQTPLLDAEAIRVISNMPKWKLGKSGNKVVRCSYTLPVSFKLK